jgi:hypothetical protein
MRVKTIFTQLVKGGIFMVKKLAILFLAGCFFSGAFCVNALAYKSLGTVDPEQKGEAIQHLIGTLQSMLQTAEPSDDLYILEIKTLEVLEGLLDVVENDDPEKLAPLINGYASDLGLLQFEDLDNCTISFVIGVGSSSISLVTNLTGEGGAGCVVINEINTITDIIIKKLSYDICVLENSGTPDDAAIEELQSQQLTLEGIDFVTSVIDVAACNSAPTIMNYFSVFMNFLDLFPDFELFPQPEE